MALMAGEKCGRGRPPGAAQVAKVGKGVRGRKPQAGATAVVGRSGEGRPEGELGVE
jgi:hypothetical protein